MNLLGLRILGNVLWEQVFWFVDVGAELEVVDVSDITRIKILPEKDLEEWFSWWDQFELFENASELFGSDVAALGPILVEGG